MNMNVLPLFKWILLLNVHEGCLKVIQEHISYNLWEMGNPKREHKLVIVVHAHMVARCS